MNEKNLYESVLESLPKDAHCSIAWLALVRCFSSIESVLMRHFAQEYNSSLPRYDVLTALVLNRGGLTMSELAAMLEVTKGNITGVVRRLKEEKLALKSTSSKDRRVQSVKISARGLRLWHAMHADYERIVSALLNGQSEAQIIALVSALRQTHKFIQTNADNLQPS